MSDNVYIGYSMCYQHWCVDDKHNHETQEDLKQCLTKKNWGHDLVGWGWRYVSRMYNTAERAGQIRM